MRPVKFKDEDFKNMYTKVFAAPQSAMTPVEFNIKIAHMATVHHLKKGELYAELGSKLEYLSVLISGQLQVCDVSPSGAEVAVNEVLPFEFIDSPQWLIRHKVPDQKFVVVLRATEDSKYIGLPLEKLEHLLTNHPEFKSYFDGVVGSDVAEKLLHVDPSILNDEHPIISQQRKMQTKSRKIHAIASASRDE
eukprot:gene32684-40338_t